MKGEILISYNGMTLASFNIWAFFLQSQMTGQIMLKSEIIENSEIFIDGEKVEKPEAMFLDN